MQPFTPVVSSVQRELSSIDLPVDSPSIVSFIIDDSFNRGRVVELVVLDAIVRDEQP